MAVVAFVTLARARPRAEQAVMVVLTVPFCLAAEVVLVVDMAVLTYVLVPTRRRLPEAAMYLCWANTNSFSAPTSSLCSCSLGRG